MWHAAAVQWADSLRETVGRTGLAVACALALVACGGELFTTSDRIPLASGASVRLPGEIERTSSSGSGMQLTVWTGEVGRCSASVTEIPNDRGSFDLDLGAQGAFDNVPGATRLRTQPLTWLGADALDVDFDIPAGNVQIRLVAFEGSAYFLGTVCQGSAGADTETLFRPMIDSFVPPSEEP